MKRVHLLAVGNFGEAVAGRLAAVREDTVVSAARTSRWPLTTSAAWPEADLRVLLSWREAPRLADVLDARSADWRTPWLPVVLEHPRLRVGPVVAPGHGACYACFLRRRKQHEPDAQITAALNARYDADPDAGPQGFLPHQVSLAAGMAEAEIGYFDAGTLDERGGLVRHYHLLEHQITTSRVLRVHGCGRCNRAAEPTSSWQQLADDLTAILGQPGAQLSGTAPGTAQRAV
jgi:bacteriocin biosynthesis cyclodehydratase domain-containing protein